jgi:transcriptional regulator with XRE-family HTH domain
MVLLRRVIGDALRARRQAQHRTLREVSTAANVSLGYLSEIERGQKEASSELLSSICDALGTQLSEVLRDVSHTMALAEQMEDVLVPVEELPAAPVASPEPTPASTAGPEPARARAAVADGQVSVAVHYSGPLKATLRATRMSRPDEHPDSRREVAYVG